jgi:hypothetical protein
MTAPEADSYLPGALPPAGDHQGSSRIWSLREAQALLAFMGLGDDERQMRDDQAKEPSG